MPHNLDLVQKIGRTKFNFTLPKVVEIIEKKIRQIVFSKSINILYRPT